MFQFSTSPSVYLQVVGTAAVHDLCTTIDPILTNPVMAFSPGELSTWKPPSASEGGDYFAVGNTYFDPNAGNFDDHVGTFAPLAIKDLANPTWGLGISGTSDDGNVITTIGPPWLPLISPPMEAFSLDPAWQLLCTGLLTDPMNINSLALFDPPIALTPGPGLVPAPVIPVAAPTPLPAPNHADTTTVPGKQAAPSAAAAEPANSPTDPADPPARTGDPGRDGPSPSVAKADPARPGSPPGDPAATPTNKSYPPSTPEAPAGGSEDPSNGQDDLSAKSKGLKPDATQTVPADLKRPASPAPQQVDGSQPLTQGLGAIIYNAFGKAGHQNGEITNEVKTITLPVAGVQKVSIGGGQILSIDSSGLILEGKKYSVGGPAVTLSNNVYTIIPSNGDDSLIKRPSSSPDTLVIAGQTVAPNPTALIIAGSRVLPSGSIFTISNTPISLDPSGILVIGSSSFSLPRQSVFTVGTQTFTANPTGFTFNGATISPGAAAQTVDGTVLSLGYSGALAIGTSTYSLPTPSSNDPAISPFIIAGQTFTPNPSAFSIAGTMILAGGSPITLAGTIISLGQSGALVIGSSTVLLPTPTSTLLAITPITLAGQIFTPNPSAFSIAGTTISAGGPAVTIAGTIISLRPSGTLIVGSSTISLLAPQTNSPTLSDIDGLSFQAQSSFAIVDGMTISPGAPGIMVDGESVSLEAGGATLDVGTGRFALPTGSVNKSAVALAFEGGQGKGVEVSLMVLLSFIIGGGLMLMV